MKAGLPNSYLVGPLGNARVAASYATTFLIYALNEIADGGWLLPSNVAFNPVGTGRLDAVADVFSRARLRSVPARRSVSWRRESATILP